MQGVVNFDGKTSELFTIWSGVKQGCVLAPTLLAFFSHFCLIMLSNTPRKASTYTPEVMASCSTWHGWGPRPKSVQSSSRSYFLLMMPHWPHTKRKRSSSLSPSSLIPVRSLAWPSASGRQKSGVRMFHHLPTSLLITKCLRSLTTSLTLAWSSPATCRLTVRSTSALQKLPV